MELVKSKPAGPEGSPPMSAEEVEQILARLDARGMQDGVVTVTEARLKMALRTVLWAIESLKAAYLGARDELDDGDDSANMSHWIGADLAALGVDVDKL